MGLSVLIATKNHAVDDLLTALNLQASRLPFPVEVLVGDDASDQIILKENTLSNFEYLSVTLKKNSKNLGALATKYQLAKSAKYPHLLLLDADVALQEHFLENYLPYIQTKKDCVSGGIAIPKDLSKKNKALRYCYGLQRESRPASERNKNEYSNIVSANLLIGRDLFLKAAAPILSNNYGLDVFLGGQLKKLQTEIVHIDNAVIHLGIEENATFLNKVERGLKHMAWYVVSEEKYPHSGVFYNYQRLQKLNCFNLFLWFFERLKPMILKQITSSKPNLLLFDMYRLGLFCSFVKNYKKA